MKDYGYMEQIQNPEQVWFSSLGGDDLTVIIYNDEGKKQLFFPVWQPSDNGDEMITLDSIKKQTEGICDSMPIMVIAESYLNGYIYRYGNYGDFWVQNGEISGYA